MPRPRSRRSTGPKKVIGYTTTKSGKVRAVKNTPYGRGYLAGVRHVTRLRGTQPGHRDTLVNR